jgi:murein DD-endopeptidase MepM/ murein hydrolase activator NlpD
MRKKHKFYFNPHDLVYVLHRPKNWEKALRVGGIMASTFLVVLLTYSIFLYQSKTPNDKKLQHQLSFYKHQVEMLNRKMSNVNSTLAELESRDNKIYRVIFEADPLPSSVLDAGTGGTDKYKEFEAFSGSELLIDANKKLDNISSKLLILDQSYAQLTKLAKNRKEMLATVPAIQPISNKDLKQLSSGFGYRLHPIYKQMQLHTGIDFTAPTGTDIYATGDGVVMGKDPNGSGYGNHVIINHGYGYKTLYGHMSKVLVKPGQKIKRGELIGKVGSTGQSTAPHLHYEVMKDGKKINPINFFHNDLNSKQYEQLIELANQSNQSLD